MRMEASHWGRVGEENRKRLGQRNCRQQVVRALTDFFLVRWGVIGRFQEVELADLMCT